ncbi:cucumber peeling cupredoxin-like [Juglans microcarpa x Juglans regia]|uniref:cucumber peeling cupredoxin-like n=1 Tax=Juglans microcarpa x Juglans regia TaxID=2249226 RepID=UPI001B7DBF48|nr:cucumber peeling cupredoxin-like [Juglans microcarpa x Juglans regia]
MEKFTSVVAVFGVVAVLLLQCAAAQTVHVVGDSIGWSVPTGGASAYETWAASKQFVVGDILLFNFATNEHDVLQVPKESYDSCSSSNPIGDTITTGPVNITLSTAGTHYYICTIGRHCLSGQKLAVTVSGSPSAVPPTTSTPPSTPTTPTTPSPTSGTPADCAPTPASSPTPTPASSPTPTPGTMSPPGSSSSGVFANLFISFLSIAMGFLF